MVNREDGREIRFSLYGLKKTRSHSADVRVMQVVPYLDELLERGVPIYTAIHEPKSQNDKTRAWHYYAAPVEIGGDRSLVKMVVREDSSGNLYYDNDVTSVEVLKEEEGRPESAVQLPKPGSSRGDLPAHSLLEWWRSVNSADASKVVDEEGRPLVVYHGTPDARGVAGGFKSAKERFGIDDPGRAFFFTNSPKTAETYADDRRAWDYQGAEPGVFPVYLNIRNPFVIDAGGQSWGKRGGAKTQEDQIADAKARAF